MEKKILEDQRLRYAIVNPGNLFEVAFKIIDSVGILKAMSNKSASDYDVVEASFDDPMEVAQHFKGGGKITLSTLEALSMAYLSTYYADSAQPGTKFHIGTDIEDRRSHLTERELYLSDGLLVETHESGETSFMPFQQAIAQNLGFGNDGKPIDDVIIREASRKIARRADYNDVSGLMIGVLTNDRRVDLQKIVDSCDFGQFTTAFLMLYADDGRSCTVIHLDNLSSVEDLFKQARLITPTLKHA